MYIIKTTLNSVQIPKETEFSICVKNEFFLDKTGNITEAIEESNGVPYGDICIKTPNSEYRFCKVYAAYEVVARMIYYMNQHLFDSILVLDLEKLCEESFGFRMYGKFTHNE